MRLVQHLLGALVALLSLGVNVQADQSVLRISVLKFGTVNWELDTIKHHELDKAHGFDLSVQGVAGGAAAKVAFQGGEADVIVSDWLWVARQRAAGKDFVFIPYSKAVGGLLVPKGSSSKELPDLAGSKIGIAGGPLDKSWLILRAYTEKNLGMDLKAQSEQVFGAPPLIFKAALSGELDGAINFWHFAAKMEATGMHKLVDISDAARELGLDPETPLLGYVVKGSLVREQPELVQGFAEASREAKVMLASDDAEWERLRRRMNAKSDAEFSALKAGFRAGIPAPRPVDPVAAARMLEVMYQVGGEDLLGQARNLPEGTFYDPEKPG
ncbi:ABC transporter substrate-binding protein [Phaeobacter gallaeciensis]|uniref:ABC-type nitrate/sulfonate/bicarbonate transport system, periplasmic component n=1 Tax=Phaeobacter gallaeciensis TaxID=60890 RepID=A0AAC9ZCW6_9RHOB|nr:ABC transporter substrate-binding protein [Phaeobacter gallaeciensis]AHD11621.1 ABC-type nitrate/sulfonate/bicarbonate transport system, periplasmic component [Phaeobacter gallaeciensis DSM 26640]ATE94885.1 ABC-type nitrate/sulfonate/bicarbonate transport system, periplasmic component [Phaeobacter gallaeciensis]ATE99156.1 ABC-type nitrate/sulfonate/bicarbonate transport system, periplasmic component [Phaeobacter gallaeciensis]ATF03549.1 ABC-type nitrate/sulfonate/bicarbonate transport system